MVVTTPSDCEIVMTRTFDAPAALVFEAWTTPEHVARWWGFESSQMLVCEIDLRVGGTWRYVAHKADMEVAFHGEYREIVAPTRLVYTEVYEGAWDETGAPDGGGLITNTFEERNGRTTLTSTCVYASKDIRDMVVDSGMEDGAAVSLDRLEDLLAALSASR